MARVFSDMSAAGPSSVQWAFLYLLQLLLEHVGRPHRRRGSLHARLRWDDSFGGAADHMQLACSSHQMFFRVEAEDDNTAGQNMASWNYRSHPALSTWNCRATMFNKLLDYYVRRLRSTATLSRPDPCNRVCRRETGDGIQQTVREGSGDNFDGIACSSPDLEQSTASRRRATTNGHRTMSEPLTEDDVEPYTSTTYPADRYRLPGNNGQYSTSNQPVLRFCLNTLRHELDRGYPRTVSIDHRDLWDWSRRISIIDHSNLLWDWIGRPLWCSTTGDLDFSEVFSERRSRRLWQDDYFSEEISMPDVDSHDWTKQPCRRQWQDYSSEEIIPMQDDDSHDRKEQSCIDSTDAVSELHDGSCLDQNSVCSDTDIDTHCSEPMHGRVTTSTALVNCVLPRSADTDTVASSSTQLDGSSNHASSSTTEQSVSSDDIDDCDSMISSITTEELLVRQPDSNEEMEVSMAQEQSSETGNGSEATRRQDDPWWLIPGFRFLPTDKEIVIHYLKPKVLNRRLPVHHAVEEGHNVYALDADEITLDGNCGDKERLGFFFVNKQDACSYSNGCYHPTPDGYWRIRGRPALVRHRGRAVAFKTAMDYHRGRPPHGCRTPWSMFEYALNGCQVDLLNLEQPWMNGYVVCKVRRRESKRSAKEERRRRPGLLPRRPFLKKISPRRFRSEMVVSPKADVAPKRKIHN